MSAYLLALLLQPTPPVPPTIVPTPIVRVPAPMINMNSRAKEPPIPVTVRATSGGRTLFSDTLLIDSLVGATYSQNRSEALALRCTYPERHDRQQNSSFNMRLGIRDGEGGQRLISVTLNWTRPVDSASCAAVGSRGVSIIQTVLLEPGKTAVLTGDGGLRLELTAR